jgi:hypothetical protein
LDTEQELLGLCSQHLEVTCRFGRASVRVRLGSGDAQIDLGQGVAQLGFTSRGFAQLACSAGRTSCQGRLEPTRERRCNAQCLVEPGCA